MPQATSGTATTSPATISVGAAGKFTGAVTVCNDGAVGSGADLHVQVPVLHGGTDFDILKAGETQTYEDPNGKIASVVLKTLTSTAPYRVAVTWGNV